jgi:hypothetical protein
MDRQAVALFGGIVAVGLGPAIWLGGTLFRTDPGPPPVPTVTWQQVTASPGADDFPESSPDPLPTVPTDFFGGDVQPGPARLTPSPTVSPGGVPATPSPTGPAGSTPDPSTPPDSPAPPSGTPSPVLPSDLFGG